MNYIAITAEYFDDLKRLHSAYKSAIGEDVPTNAQFDCLYKAIKKGDIHFFGCLCDNELVACCSISYTYSTFNYNRGGVFEDFYIMPQYRHHGIAKKLVQFSIKESDVKSLTVGCADCDVEMYKAIGFCIPLGNLLAFDC